MLTNEANFVLHHFYKIYKDRLDDGYSDLKQSSKWKIYIKIMPRNSLTL
ncbi:hypothetical protein [Staphylococcus coagulans]|nr:hypothetical protein [Staphylococcus coagulans]MBA8761753.1 hypothetical protein [Staphylococcus coagulans]